LLYEILNDSALCEYAKRLAFSAVGSWTTIFCVPSGTMNLARRSVMDSTRHGALAIRASPNPWSGIKKAIAISAQAMIFIRQGHHDDRAAHA